MKFLKKKLSYEVVLSVILVCLSILFIITSYSNNNKPEPLEVNKITFKGEYKFLEDNGWKILTDDTKLDSFKGDLYLKGNFYDKNGLIKEDMKIALFFNHIEATIFQNQVKVWSHSRDNYSDDYYGCGKTWLYYSYEYQESEPTLIVLSNPHKFGNKTAYNDFLNSIYENNGDVLHEYLHAESNLQKNTGIVLIVASLFVLGVALFASLMKLKNVTPIWLIGSIIAFLGCFFVYDSPNVDLWSKFIALNTSILIVIKFLFFFFAMLLVTSLMSEKAKRHAKPIVAATAVANVLIIIFSMYDLIFIYDADYAWALFTFISLLALLILCIFDIHRPKPNRYMFIFSMIIIISMLSDIILINLGNVEYICSKTITLFVLVCLFISLLKKLPYTFAASIRAKEMESKLQSYRVSISLSQIQHHFLYNSLTAIHYLCDKDPKQAKQAIGWFSTYLRNNLDKIKEEKPISFIEALKHIEIYLKLEKLRFEDELNIVYDIETSDFSVPSLVIQPLVENAVNHGVGDKDGGGTVYIKTRENEKYYEVIIQDDGTGFDPNTHKNDGKTHVGLINVRERLNLICHGELIIESEVGKGTCATIKIPKEEK